MQTFYYKRMSTSAIHEQEVAHIEEELETEDELEIELEIDLEAKAFEPMKKRKNRFDDESNRKKVRKKEWKESRRKDREMKRQQTGRLQGE